VVAQRVYDALRTDRYYVGATRQSQPGGGTSGADRGQLVILAAQVLSRKPYEYTRELRVQVPAALEDRGNDFTGGFEP
jgi:hypothetical protein